MGLTLVFFCIHSLSCKSSPSTYYAPGTALGITRHSREQNNNPRPHGTYFLVALLLKR